MANPEETPRPPIVGATPGAPARTRWFASAPVQALAWFIAAFATLFVGYLATAAPGPWLSSAVQREWLPREFRLARGSGGFERNEFVVAAIPGAGGALVTIETDFRSTDYSAIAWVASDVPETAEFRLIWRTDYAPTKVNSIPISVANGRLLPVVVARDANWVGHIRGLALAVTDTTSQPIRLHGVSARTGSATETASDRAAEWFAFEGFSGSSINSAADSADLQDLPLPALLAFAAGIAAFGWYGHARMRRRTTALPTVLAVLFAAAWLTLDARWTWDLARQVSATARTYAGLDWRGKHLAAEDAPLFRFIESARAKMPMEPARVFMNADLPYFRLRGAYHLYPHNVHAEPRRNAIAGTTELRAGDYFIVFQRRGVQYDANSQLLRWDGNSPIAAELLLTAPGAALFRIR